LVGKSTGSWLVCQRVQIRAIVTGDGTSARGPPLQEWQLERLAEIGYSTKSFQPGGANDIGEISSWSDIMNYVQEYYDKHGTLPTKSHGGWLMAQRKLICDGKYQRRLPLEEWQLHQLAKIGYTKESFQPGGPNALQKPHEQWNQVMDQVLEYYNKHRKLPAESVNKSLYIWFESQRASVKAYLENRKLPRCAATLEDWKLKRLVEIGYTLDSFRVGGVHYGNVGRGAWPFRVCQGNSEVSCYLLIRLC
jgi:hypothetical protein